MIAEPHPRHAQDDTTKPRWGESLGRKLAEEFRSAAPFPHLMLDDFLDPEMCRAIVAQDYGDVGSRRWTYYRHYSQKTYARTDAASFGPAATATLRPDLEDGGLAATPSGGYLNVHSDLGVHPVRHHWRRRLNLIVYLNEDWQPSYGGELELWDSQMRRCVRRIAPVFNRCIIFAVGPQSLHGFPDPVRSHESVARKCLALYYFTAEATAPRFAHVRHYARPGEGLRHLWVAADNLLLRAHESILKPLGVDDALVNRLYRWLGKRQ
jgi:hypothetical protein